MKTFCKNQENLCTFETKFLNRQKKKEKAYREGHKNGENAGIIKTIGSVMNSIERNKRQSSSSVKQIGTSNRRTK